MKELNDNIDVQLIAAARIMKNAYETDSVFRESVRKSALSVLRELKGSYSDNEISVMISDRIFGHDYRL